MGVRLSPAHPTKCSVDMFLNTGIKKKNEHVVSEIDDELYLSYHDVIKVDNNRMDRQS